MALALFFLVASVVCQQTVPTGITTFSDSTSSTPGQAETWSFDNVCGAQTETFLALYNSGSVTVNPGDVIVVDLAAPYSLGDNSPVLSYTVGVYTVVDNGDGTFTITVDNELPTITGPATGPGTNDDGDFQFGLPIPNSVGGSITYAVGNANQYFGLWVSVENADQNVPIGTFATTNSGSFVLSDLCTAALPGAVPSPFTQAATQGNPPGIRVYSCDSYAASLTQCIPNDNPFNIPNTPNLCTGRVIFSVESNLQSIAPESDGFHCPHTFTRTMGVPVTQDAFDIAVGMHTVDYSYTVNSPTPRSSTCSDSFSIIDTEAPVVQCPTNFGALADATCQATIPASPTGTFTDNCPVNVTESTSPVLPLMNQTLGLHTITYSANDGFQTTPCTYNVTVFATTGPIFSVCSTAVTVDADPGVCTASVSFTQGANYTATSCVPPVTYSSNLPTMFDYPLGTTIFQVTAEDANDNTAACNIPITVMDTQPPVIDCPNNITISTSETSQVVQYNTAARDNCNIASESCNPPSGTRFDADGNTNVVTCTAFDQAGLPDQCSFSVVVNFNTPPTTPVETIAAQPSRSASNSPTSDLTTSILASRSQVVASNSSTPTRVVNPSSTNTASVSITSTPTASLSRFASRSPSPTRTSTSSTTKSPIPPVVLPISASRSPFIQSNSPSRTPSVQRNSWVQCPENTLIELIIPCGQATCTNAEANRFANLMSIQLEIPLEDIVVQSIFGHEVTYIICDSQDVAELLNEITFGGAPSSFEGVYVENSICGVMCPVIRVEETTAKGGLLTVSGITMIFMFLIFI